MAGTSSVLTRAEPEVRGPVMFLETGPLMMGSLTKVQLDREIERGMEQIRAGKSIPAAEVEKRILLEMGL